ncbi:UDP-glycosyltransferase 91D2-like [Aegilops tauschii subsp. strangulata]|uniref:UDP-glycosyltransferase 91D2-like n=1 Tax=Aegilops tauschii subsp. strangulata TaxID=200361 RepID=UPI001ABCCB6B|nr:UDP-glycosyltransferase 91D2-like [Aegilops tauschii subsp. strangulata]
MQAFVCVEILQLVLLVFSQLGVREALRQLEEGEQVAEGEPREDDDVRRGRVGGGVHLRALAAARVDGPQYFIALRSSPELEPDAFPLLTRLYGKPAVPLGLLPPPPDGARSASENAEDVAIIQWLNALPAKSVVYVALGSEAPLRAELLRELAHGLELSGTSFLWALRNPVDGDGDGESMSILLPDGFVERTGRRGLVAARWVPQVSILAHGAVGAFLTHCGWGSVVEGLQFGHPLIMLPLAGDQGPNARLMEERKVGVLVPRDEEDGSFSRDGVAGAVRAVIVEEGGSVFADNAKKLQGVVASMECNERCIDLFIQHLRSCRN